MNNLSSLQFELAQLLLNIGAVGFSPDEPVTFKSGIKSPIYVDNRRLPFYPKEWQAVIEGFQNLIKECHLQFDVIAGIATAGIPHSATLSYVLKMPSVFVRKESKKHGTQRRVEGGNVKGLTVLLVEDLITTGGSSLSGVEALREEGAIVNNCLAIVSYGFEEAKANFAAANLDLQVLVNFDTLWQVAQQQLNEQVISTVNAWRQNPHSWRR